MEFAGAGNGWTNISRDTLVHPGIQIRRGIRGNGVKDRVAAQGTCTFVLDNMRSNSAARQGYYWPDNANCRLGFAEGIGIRVVVISAPVGVETVFVGRVDSIKAVAGNRGRRDVTVTAVDWMEEAAQFKIRGLETLDTVRADELITALLAIMPHQPAATSLDVGKDTFAFAFDSVRDGSTNAMSELSRIAMSGYDYVYLKRDGTLRYENRDYRFVHNIAPQVTLDNTMLSMDPNRNTEKIINRVEATAHPRAVDAAFAVLFSLQDKPLIAPGGSLTIRGDYTDPDKPGERIGAVDVQEALEPGLDYIADTAQATAAGTADTPATIRPASTGAYNSFTGSAADVADESDATGMQPSAGLVYHSFVMDDVAAPDNAVVTGVRLHMRIQHNDSDPKFLVLYPMLRLNGIDLFYGATFSTTTAGIYDIEQVCVTPPGAGDWTVGALNALEAGVAFNWNGATPTLLRLKVELVYAGHVEPTDRTDDFTIVVTAGGNSAEFVITNNGTDGAYLTKLQIRGRKITTYEPVVVVSEDSASISDFGERPESFDMPYQGDSTLAKAAADYILSLYKRPVSYVETVSVLANRNTSLMSAAITVDVSSLISIAEPVTGISRKYFVNGVDLNIGSRGLIVATWILAPADETSFWVLGESGRSELGDTTVVGPF